MILMVNALNAQQAAMLKQKQRKFSLRIENAYILFPLK